jgi:hypothetical protein
MADWSVLPPWAWIVIVAILFSGFRRRHYRPQAESRVVEREDPRVDDLQSRVAELENRLDFAERLLAGHSTAEKETTLSDFGRRGSSLSPG